MKKLHLQEALSRALTGRRTLVAIAAVLLILVVGAQNLPVTNALPEGGLPGVDYELGNFCLADYESKANCTANDVRIASITPSILEACQAVGDTATIQFTAQLVAGAAERYDISMFVATDGGSALSGDACYHDFLQEASVAGPWDFVTGAGPFRERESTPDACADIMQNESAYYAFQQTLTITCVDKTNDGVIDPISTCTGWHNSAKSDCLSVKGAAPEGPAKCNCATMTPTTPILIYRGYDWGDLPISYSTLNAGGGPSHAIQDSDNNNLPNTQGGVPAVWLGPAVDFSPNAEADGQPTADATGDDAHSDQRGLDDEDGVSPAGQWYPGETGSFSVFVNSSDGTCTGCKLGFWLDWNGDGDFADAGETYLMPVVFGAQTLSFDIPNIRLSPDLYARFRLYSGSYVGAYKPTGLVVNGEVEDYHFVTPLSVDLIWFEAAANDASVTLGWETASEIDNLGFNILRAATVDGPRTQVNAQLIPTLVPPGSPFGAVYEYTDSGVTPGATYYYWLQDVDLYGRLGLAGPVDAQPGPRMHVSAAKLTSRQLLPGRTILSGSVRIVGAAGLPVAGAVVQVAWTAPDGTLTHNQAITTTSGTASFRAKATQSGIYRLCVTTVSSDNWVYAPEQNTITCAQVSIP